MPSKISWSNRILVALTAVCLYVLYQSTSAVTQIGQLQTQLKQACTLASSRVEDAVSYYNEGTLHYQTFAAGWRAHGYPDIADDWLGLAERDARRAIKLADSPASPGCAPQAYSTPLPIFYPALKKAPPSLHVQK